MNAIDTNIFVYLIDEYELVKQAKAASLLERLAEETSETILLWQVAVEFGSCLCRWEHEGRIDRATVCEHIEHLQATFSCIMPSESILHDSLELSSRYSLSYWDSLLLAACADAGVDTLYSEDLDHGMTYGAVSVVNPFV